MVGWPSPEAAFFGGAALLQFLLAGVILARRGRVEWMALLALLFALNGAQSLGALLHAGFGVPVLPGRAGLLNRLFFVTDFTTSLLILYLALAYPARPAWLRHRPWVLPLLFGAFMGTVLAAFALLPLDRFFAGCVPSGCAGAWGTLGYAWTPPVVLPLLLLRWSRVLVRESSPSRRREFQWIFAAFAMRAAHTATAFPIDSLSTGYLAAAHPLWFKLLYGATDLLSLAVVPGCIAYLLARRRSVASDAQRSIEVVLLFLLLGVATTVLAGFADLDPAASTTYFLDPLNSFDFLVVRPVLVVVAFLHTELFGPLLDPRRAGTALTAAVSFAVLGLALDQRLPATPWSTAAAWAMAAALAGALALFANRLLRSRSESSRRRAIDRYVTLLEDACRRGEPTPADDARLEEERVALGIRRAQADALRLAVRERWAGDPARPWLPGDRILGRYRLQRLLGEGGMGQAWLAHDAVDDADVVLKRSTRLDEASRRGLLAEANALRRLDHPHVLGLLRAEVVGREPVLVLAYAPGGSLASRLAEGRLARGGLARLADGLLAGLEAAHRAGLVHGDLKPQNVLLAADGSPLLADFGLARGTAAGAGGLLVDATRAPGAGSLRYLAPEQLRGAAPTPSSDQYAAALVLAEAWQGHHPVPDSPDDFRTRQAILAGVRVRPGVPAGVRRALQRALAADPAARFPDVAALRSALAAAVREGRAAPAARARVRPRAAPSRAGSA